MIKFVFFLITSSWCLYAGSDRDAADLALYRQLVHDLSAETMEGRGPGTHGLGRARDYLADYFRDIGLVPAFKGSYFQAFDVRPGGRHTTVSLRVADRFAAPWQDFALHPHSGDGRYDGPVLALERSLLNDRQALATADVAGKTLLVLSAHPLTDNVAPEVVTRLAAMAAAHGAKALLWVIEGKPVPSDFKNIKGIHDQPRAEIPVLLVARDFLRIHLDWDHFLLQLGMGRPFLLEDAVIGNVARNSKWVTVHNVAGMLPGAGSMADEIVVVGGHYDHLGFGGKRSGTRQGHLGIHHGADDNASGTAGVLMLATRLARDAHAYPTNRRSLIFAGFTAEELGLQGSEYMAGNMAEMDVDRDDVVAMINFDMIGRMSERIFFIIGSETGFGWRQQAVDAAREEGLNLVREDRFFQSSDHYSFYQKKIPSIFFFTGLHDDYHTVTDTPEKINFSGAMRLLRVGEELLRDQWLNPERLRYRRRPRRSIGVP